MKSILNTGATLETVGGARKAVPTPVPVLEGPEGANGWTPVLTGEADGTRGLLKVSDWVGGKGAKPATGYVGGPSATGLVNKASAFNFNLAKRVTQKQAVTNAQGIATFVFDPAFPAAPVVIPSAVGIVTGSPAQVAVVAGTLTASGVQIQAKQSALVTGLLGLLVGFTVSILIIEV